MWEINLKEPFLNHILNPKFITPKESIQVWQKIGFLKKDPTPDHQKTKIKLKNKYLQMGKEEIPLFRLRSGTYRIFYTFLKQNIFVLFSSIILKSSCEIKLEYN